MNDDILNVINSIIDKYYTDLNLIFSPEDLENLNIRCTGPLNSMKELREEGGTLEEIFLRQARYFADHKEEKLNLDVCDNKSYFKPTYDDLNFRQLKSYFTWREMVRNGQTHSVPEIFLCIYAYELINMIGCATASEAMDKLQNLYEYTQTTYTTQRFKNNLQHWIRDFECFILKDNKRTLYKDTPCGNLLEYKTLSDQQLALDIAALGAVDLNIFPSYASHKQAFCRIAATAFDAYVATEGKGDPRNVLGSFTSRVYTPFKDAIIDKKDFDIDGMVFEMSNYSKCINVLGDFYIYSFHSKKNETFYKTFLRKIDSSIRAITKCARKTKVTENFSQGNLIENEAKKYFTKKIDIDISLLGNIRKDSDVTARLLITEEEKELPPPEPEETPGGLSEAEKTFLSLLLANKPYKDFLKSNKLMESVIVDSINEKLFDLFGDTVIQSTDELQILPDYIEEIKESVLK